MARANVDAVGSSGSPDAAGLPPALRAGRPAAGEAVRVGAAVAGNDGLRAEGVGEGVGVGDPDGCRERPGDGAGKVVRWPAWLCPREAVEEIEAPRLDPGAPPDRGVAVDPGERAGRTLGVGVGDGMLVGLLAGRVGCALEGLLVGLVTG